MTGSGPAYFERIVASYHAGSKNRCAHLGHWDSNATDLSGSFAESSKRLLLSTSASSFAASEFHVAQERLDEQMLKLGALDDRQVVLDVGCGLGSLLERVNELWTEMTLTGLNVDPEQLEICHRIRPQPGNSVRWLEGDACQLPFADQTFDRVFCVEAMFHFSSRRQFLEEVWRVLKPRGRLVASDIVLLESPGANDLPRFAVSAILNDGYGPWPDPWCDAGTLPFLCEELGFCELTQIDATRNTLPSYDFIVPSRFDDDRDPGDPATRAAIMLRWLHKNARARYEYFTALKNAESLQYDL